MNSLIRPATIGGSTLVRDYLRGSPAAATFYGTSPFELDGFRAKFEEVSTRFGPDERQRVADAVQPTSPGAAERLSRFVAEGGAVVTTGQQAGFLTGPLYTIYKAVSAVVLARHLEERLGVIVLPVFWVASDDHDWAEANHATLLDRKGRLRRFTLPGTDDRPLPMSERRLGGPLDPLCDDVLQAVAASGSNAERVNQILAPYRRSAATVGDAFKEALLEIFRDLDLLVTDPASPVIKRASGDVMAQALTSAGAHEERLLARTAAIEEAGYQPQVSILEQATNVFMVTADGRERLFRAGEGYRLRTEREARDPGEVLALLRSEPERFSPNVLLRPVVESAVFPTLSYVGGPGEIAYFAQVTALFEAYGIAPPMVVPRFSGLVVERSVERVLASLQLRIEDLSLGREALLDRVARDEIPDGVSDALERLRRGLADGFEDLISAAKNIDPTLEGALGSIRNRGLSQVGRAESKIVRAIKRGEQVSTDQLDRVLNALRPGGAGQDRVVNVLPFIGRYGDHFLREVDRVITECWRRPEPRTAEVCGEAGAS